MGMLTEYAADRAATYNISEASEYVRKDFKARNTAEELKKLLEKKGIGKDSFKKSLGSANAVNVDNWLNGNVRISRESAIKILSALEITEKEEAEEFLRYSCFEDGFYERSYKDLIYLFCLKNKLGFQKAQEIIKKYNYLDKPNEDAKDFSPETTLTQFLKKGFEELETEEELGFFLGDNKDILGNYNRTAYTIFIDLYDMVVFDIQYFKSEEEREKFARKEVSIGDICAKFRDLFPERGNTELNLISQMVEQDVPNRERLPAVVKKEAKLPRKYLILFFLLARECEGDDYDDRINELNASLSDCGMPLLDSRNYFDWIIMNTIYASSSASSSEESYDVNEYFGMVDRFKEIIEKIYGIKTEKTEAE